MATLKIDNDPRRLTLICIVFRFRFWHKYCVSAGRRLKIFIKFSPFIADTFAGVITPRTSWLLFQRLLLFGLAFFLSAQGLFALDPSRSLFEYNIQTWNRQNGLPFNRISAIAQTSDGYIWVGTQNGLGRFDGVEFTHVVIPNRPGWHSMSVSCLKASPRGGLWFGLDTGGTFGYFDGTNRFDAISAAWASAQINPRSILEDPDGSIWVGGQQGFVGAVQANGNNLYSNNVGLVQTVYRDPTGRLWVGSFEKGLFYWQDGKLNPAPAQDLLGVNIRAITMDPEGRLWVGTSWGLRCYDRDLKRSDRTAIWTEIQALMTDDHGAVWIGTSGDGLYRYVNGETSNLRKTNGLAEDYVSSLCEDREGSIWVGTRDGLTQLSDLKFPTASTIEGPLNSPVHGVCSSTNGGIWCATGAGVYNYKDHTVTLLPATTNLNPYVKRVFEARNGDIYTLSGLREVHIYSHGKLIAHFPNSDWPTALTEDSQSVIVSVGAQLYRVSPKGMTPFEFKGAPPQFHWIRNLSTCADGSLLVASVDGLFKIHGDKIEHWSVGEGVADQDITCVIEDGEGTLWLGGSSGLTRIRNNKVSVIHLSTPDPTINAIVADDFGNLWLSCSSGVIQADRRSLNDFADGHSQHFVSKLYDGVDALKTVDLTEVEAVGCKTPDGKVWFGGPLGAVQIDPLHIPFDPWPPPVRVQKVFVDGIPWSATNEIRRGNGELAFQYTALSFIAPQKIRFRYKLEGYDTEWTDAGSQRSALYANLKPGQYRFHVEACNVDGVWNTEGASFAVELPPLFYQTLWFKMAAGVVFILVLLALYGWRTRHLREKEKALKAANDLLENRVRDRTKELVEGRNLLRTLIDHLPDSVFVKDTDGRVIIDNLTHAHYLGFESTAQSVGKSDFECFPREKAEEFRQPELTLFETGKEYNAEENLTLKNGEIRWMRTTKVPLRDAHGKIIGLAGINRDITERKKWEAEMEALHSQLLETSRHAGMAEVATSVLHNVGNVLNSVNVSASIVDEQIRASNLDRLQKAIELLKENQPNLAEFFRPDGKGAKLVSYLDAIFEILQKERDTVQSEVEALSKNVEHIKKIVAMQQTYARVSGVIEAVNPVELMEDSLRLHEAAFQRHAVKVVREYADVPKIYVDRHKVIQILVNLLGNAKYACDSNEAGNRVVHVRVVEASGERIRMEVADNGMGIASENLTRIFSYGFTTRKNGHGFGLHSGALAAREMGGSLHAQSNGPGKGAAFALELPIEHQPATRTRPEQPKQLEPA